MYINKIFLAIIMAFTFTISQFAPAAAKDDNCTITFVLQNDGTYKEFKSCGEANGQDKKVEDNGGAQITLQKDDAQDASTNLNNGNVTAEELIETYTGTDNLQTFPLPAEGQTSTANTGGDQTLNTTFSVKERGQFQKVIQLLRSGEIHGPFDIYLNGEDVNVEHLGKNDPMHWYVPYNLAYVESQLTEEEFAWLMDWLGLQDVADLPTETWTTDQVESALVMEFMDASGEHGLGNNSPTNLCRINGKGVWHVFREDSSASSTAWDTKVSKWTAWLNAGILKFAPEGGSCADLQ